MRSLYTILLLFLCAIVFGQGAQIKAQLVDEESIPAAFANVLLYSSQDSTLSKVETSDDQGVVNFFNIPNGNYYLEASYVGFSTIKINDIEITDNFKFVDLGKLLFKVDAVNLEEAVITASRALVEVKPDRTVFNVEGTINSTGDNGIGLLRKAPGVLVDNNNNISVLGRSGVLVYVDGKRLPLNGDDLVNYLTNLPAEQIDRIDIITNPGAKYEAEGNAGIIDIRLKRDKNLGLNGSIGGNFSQGQYAQGNGNASGNFRNKVLNTFVSGGYGQGESFMRMIFDNYQNGFRINEDNLNVNGNEFMYYRWGTDFYVGKDQTIGFLINGGSGSNNSNSENRTEIANGNTPNKIDSLLFADNMRDNSNKRLTLNLNYALNQKTQSLNIDLDYGRFRNKNFYDQPNLYYDPIGTQLLSQNITEYDTPTDIDIYTFKIDYEKEIFGGRLGTGSKVSKVTTGNNFQFYNVIDSESILNLRRSNDFFYDENVYAAYLTFSRPINKKFRFSAGLRSEYTDATGDLQAYLDELQEDPVELNYLQFFPSLGLTYQLNQKNTLSLNYGRRINRPDYNVLNPFRIQLSELSFQKGNAFLSPEIVNNIELGYTLNYMYNFKLGYSKTTDQITRLIGPDNLDPRAGFITWENLAEQTIFSLSASAPIQITKWWNAYINANGSHIDNQADYGEGAVVDVQTFTYSFFQQSTFSLPYGFKFEISGYYSGPGVWGGVFLYESQWSLNMGLQKKFFNDKLNVRVNFSDIFYESGFDGFSEFNGLRSEGSGRWDSRRGALSMSYNFGNQNVKSRNRKTGLEAEAGRVGEN